MRDPEPESGIYQTHMGPTHGTCLGAPAWGNLPGGGTVGDVPGNPDNKR